MVSTGQVTVSYGEDRLLLVTVSMGYVTVCQDGLLLATVSTG